MRRILATSLASLSLAAPSVALAGVDFLSQELTVDLASNPDTITVHAELRLRADTDTAKIRVIALAPDSTSLAWNGIPVQATSTSTTTTITLPAPIAAGTEGVLSVVLSGAPDCDYSGYVMCQHAPDLTYLLPPYLGTSWYLDNSASIDEQAITLHLRVAEGHHAAALGVAPTVVSNGDGTDTITFVTNREVQQIAFLTGMHDTLAGDSAGFPTRGLYWGDDTDKARMQRVIDEGSKLAPIFGGLWGPVSVDEIQYGMVGGQTAFAGTEIEGLVLLHEGLFAPAYDYILTAANHELGHLWWGTMVWAPGAVEAGFFSESLAEYSLWRGLGILDDPAVRASGTRMNAVWYMYRRPTGTDRPVLTTMGTEAAVFSVYHKGSTVVRTLEEAVGQDVLDAALANLVAAGPGHATIDEFVQDLQAGSSLDVTSFFATWLKGTGFPVLTLTPKVEEAPAGWRVDLGASCDDFPMSLPVVALLEDGTTVKEVLEITSGAGAASFDLDARPVVVQIDPEWTAVRELHPSMAGDLSFDGAVDGDDLIEVALRVGTRLPTTRRKDGKYDPLYDVDGDREVGDADLDYVVERAKE